MESMQSLFKGELMEELLRSYFINLGYYVTRGVKFKYEGHDITDVDLYLYNRTSSLTRQRINVDIKNKKSPQAFERILWATGLQKLLGFDSCIVATTDNRPAVQTFGHLHNTIILDGTFLSKLRTNASPERLSEEEFISEIVLHNSYKTFNNKDWRHIYEMSKSNLLAQQDFSGANSTLVLLSYFIEKALTDEQKRVPATRLIYLILSHLLLTVDFILKDIVVLEQTERERRLSHGFKFGNLGKEGVDRIIAMAGQISGKSPATFIKSLESIPIDILKDFFAKNENAKNLFIWAKEFEALGFKRKLVSPSELDPQLRSVISVFLDYYNIERKKFFNLYVSNGNA